MAARATAEQRSHSGFRRGPSAANTEAVEDYAKAIHALAERGGGPVADHGAGGAAGGLAGLGDGDAEADGRARPRQPRALPRRHPDEPGERVALEVIRHHRLLEAYLAEALGMPWDRVHDEAEVLEHYISEELEERIAAALGDPSHDPHGDPIPDRDLELGSDEGVALAELEPGDGGTFSRVSDSDPEMLRYLAERGIKPGAALVIRERQPFGGPLFVEVGGAKHAIGGELAERMLISRD